MAPLHATLATWEDAVWLDLLDRNNSAGGRNSDLGVLKRWIDEIDRKYLLDIYVLAPNFSEDYRWSRRMNGFRWLSGSLNRRDLATFAAFKAEAPIGSKWDLGARLDMVRLPRTKRSAFRFYTGYNVSDEVRLAGQAHLDPEKPGTDIGVSLEWRTDRHYFFGEFYVIDIFNDLIHVTFDAAGQPQIDLTEDYLTQPFALHGTGDVVLLKNVRLELYGAYFTTSRLRVTDRNDGSYGFVNTEDVWYGAGLVEYKPSAGWLLGVFATNHQATSSKVWAAESYLDRGYELDERTTRAGALAAFRPTERLELSLQGERNWRPERRVMGTSTDSTISYTLESWLGTLGTRWQTRGSMFVDVWLAYHKSDEPLGTGQVPSAGSLEADQFRISVDVGWWFTSSIWFSCGFAQDLGPDESGNGFGGARGRGVFSW